MPRRTPIDLAACLTVITKSGSGSFQPIYSATTNRMTQLPGNIVPTYDADGNLTYDSYHSYTWLADGHVATIDTSTITYDAMGNKVEENVGGTIHEYVSAFGVSAQMTAQSENTTSVALPGGVQALYSGGTLQRFRFPDWQGTIRAESSTARVFTESLAFAPFGERYAVKGAPYNVDSFTGSPDQIVPDEYDFSARELHNGQGRWISPDPMPGTGNKYVYADNNPLSNVDVYGLFAVEVNGLQVYSDDSSVETLGSKSESYQFTTTSLENAQNIQFLCSALDCTAPGTDKMLQGMGLIAPPPATQTAGNQQRAQTAQAQQQGQPAQAQNQGAGQSSGSATFNLGGTPVKFSWETYSEPEGSGVKIEATPEGCNNCVWAQTVSGRDIKGGAKADTQPGADPKKYPFTGATEHPGQLYDRPERPLSASTSLSYVSTMGVSDGKTLNVKGSLTWGFSVSKGGQVRFSGVRPSTVGEQRGSLIIWKRATGMETGP